MNGLTVRYLYPSDIHHGFTAALAALSPCGLTDDEAMGVLAERLRQGIKTYVAVLDGIVIGTASLLVEQKFIHHGGKVAHIEDVAVHVDYQHHGVGESLMQAVLAECRAQGCYKVILDCAEDVVPFYERLGFERWEQAMRIDL